MLVLHEPPNVQSVRQRGHAMIAAVSEDEALVAASGMMKRIGRNASERSEIVRENRQPRVPRHRDLVLVDEAIRKDRDEEKRKRGKISQQRVLLKSEVEQRIEENADVRKVGGQWIAVLLDLRHHENELEIVEETQRGKRIE